MAVNFPSNPTNGQTITVSGITYAYDSTQGVWSDSPQGLTQAIDALTDVDTSTVAPTNGQVLQWNSTDSEWQPADSSAGVTVYATIDDLPLSGVAEGSMALVDSTDKLYIFSDTGWYSISIVNQTPSISGVSATYTLATDGTATVVTVTATDPEGLPLTYSIVSDTSGNIATVTQGTGANTNQWTITPSTSSANAGNFTLVFRASDGTNVASASSTFTLEFGVSNSNYTTALITSVGANNAVNNSFDDASTNNHTITVNGNVTQGTFSPYRHSGYSHFYQANGTQTHSATIPALGSSGWTIEAWFYRTGGLGSGIQVAGHIGAINSSTGCAWGFDGGTSIVFRAAGTTDSTFGVSDVTDTWSHIAFVYNGTVLECFVNGSSAGTVTRSLNITDTSVNVGYGNTNFSYDGYITDLRLSSTARTISASPNGRLNADTNTVFLLNHITATDSSSNSASISTSGTVDQKAWSPFDHDAYSASDYGGSMYFDGSGDGLSAPNHTSFDIGSGDFTIETWFYSSNPDAGYLFGKGNGQSASGTSFWVSGGSGSGLYLFYGSSYITMVTGALPVNQWTHLAFVRNGTNFSTYINGKSVHSTTASITVNTTTNVLQIADYPPTDWVGFQSDFWFVKGTAVYTSDFTPPTAPLTAITNTSLLLNGTDAGIIDKSQSVKTITLNGDVKSSTAQTKHLSSSVYFDGAGDSLSLPDSPNLNFGSGDSTIEMWVYPLGTGTFNLMTRGSSGYSGFVLSSTGFLESTNGSSWGVNMTFSTAITANSWQHVAVVRNGSTITAYRDGTSVGTASISGSVSSAAQSLAIGERAGQSNFQGYMSDIRITKGLARYTANFTPPSAALEG